MDSMRDLFVEQLRDIYSAENQLVKALPKMASAASNDELRSAFDHHLEQTREHIDRLDTVFNNLEEESEGESCKGMAGLIAEGKQAIEADSDGDVKDAWLIAAAQRVEHYEIAAYATVKSMASLLDEDEAASLLEETLNEEKQTDMLLAEISAEINPQAVGGRSGGNKKGSMKPMRRASSGMGSSQSRSHAPVKASAKRKR